MKFKLLLALLGLFTLVRCISAQADDSTRLPDGMRGRDKPVNPDALELFIDGKTLELQDNYIGAIQKYKEALKIEKAAGIYYTLSKLYYNVSQYQSALESGLEALKMDPDNIDYKDNLADVYIILNYYSDALKYLKEVLVKKPDDVNVLYNIGRLYETMKQPSEAIKYYEKITEEYEYDETVLERMIDIYDGYKDYANEAAAMEKLLSLNPANTNLKYVIANTYLKIPDFDNALRIFDNILTLDPKNRDVQSEIIKIYFHQHRTDLAFEKFGKLIDKDTVDFNTKIGIALAFYDAAREDSSTLSVAKSILENLRNSYPNQWMPEFYIALIDAQTNNVSPEAEFQKVLTEADTSVEAHVQVGFYYFEKNKLDDALKIFKHGAEQFPDDFRLNFLAGNTYYRLAKQKEALPYLEKAYKISPTDINTISTLGIIYDDLVMDPECEKLYEEALKIYPDNILLLNNYAYHLAERGIKLKDALEMSKKTIDKEPTNSSYLDTYGWIFYKLKDYKNAQIYIEKAVKIQPNATLYQHMGDVYEGMGDIVKALKYWNQALKMEPDNKDVQYKVEKYK
jgi:tetratricopeptide (TPR) repeat protein